MAAIPERADACALSPLQYGMLFHYLERGPHTGCDIQQLDLSLRDETLDVARLVCAWQLVAERHPTLRSCFRWEGLDAPQQDIMAAVDVPVVHHDLSAHTAADRAVAVEQFLTSDRLRGFDLNAAPLWRITLFDLGEAGHRMVWTYSHAILDGCYTEVVRELFDAYDALGDGVAPQFRERPAYRDHIAWLQQDWSSRAASARGFWRERLNLFFKPTTLDAVQGTTGSGRPATGHETLRFRLSPTTTASLRRLGEVHGFPVSAFVQAAWAMVLSAFTGEDDIVFGEIRDCRGSSIADAEAIIGLLINTVPVRARVPRDRPLLALLRDLVDGQAAVRPFEHTPLVEAAGCADVPRGTALFDTAVMVSETGDDIRFKGFRRSAEPGFVLHEQTIFAFTLRAVLEPSIAFTLSFDRARFDSDWARRLAMLLKRLLLAMARRPEMTLGELPRLPARDERALAAFNTTAVQAPAAVCLHEMVEAQVNRTPDAVALTCGSESLTFRELDERANRVAHALVLHGVRPNQTVGIFADHSLDMVVGLLGILKAGGAYIPLDPTYPAERVAMMLEDTQPRVVLTAERLRAHLPPRAAHVTALEAFGRERRPERPRTSVRPDHLAYVMFTSGSTGRPKGVQIEHRNVVSFFGGIDDVLGTTPGVWLALTGISFDISVSSCSGRWRAASRSCSKGSPCARRPRAGFSGDSARLASSACRSRSSATA